MVVGGTAATDTGSSDEVLEDGSWALRLTTTVSDVAGQDPTLVVAHVELQEADDRL